MVHWRVWIIHLTSFFSKGKVSISLSFNYHKSHAKGVFDPRRGWASKSPPGHLENQQIEEKLQRLWGNCRDQLLPLWFGKLAYYQQEFLGQTTLPNTRWSDSVINSKGPETILCLYQGFSTSAPLTLASRQSSVVGTCALWGSLQYPWALPTPCQECSQLW